MEKKFDGNDTRMLQPTKQQPTKQHLYSHQPLITKVIRRTKHAGHCWRSRDELIRGVLMWTPTHGRSKAGRPARTYIQQLCADAGCIPEDLPEAMEDREGWRERVRDISAAADDDDRRPNLCNQKWGGSPWASVYMLSTSDILKAPGTSLRPSRWIVLRVFCTKFCYIYKVFLFNTNNLRTIVCF